MDRAFHLRPGTGSNLSLDRVSGCGSGLQQKPEVLSTALENPARNWKLPTKIFCSGFWIAGCATLAGVWSQIFLSIMLSSNRWRKKKEAQSVFPTWSLLNGFGSTDSLESRS
jgi:hypothetical protein